MSTATIERVRRRFVADGLAAAVRRKPPAREYRRALDGEAEAHLVALSCSEPPPGKAKWSMRLLAERLVELRVVEAVSDETVRRVLKKTRSSRGSGERWCIPPKASGEFVWRMEDVLEVYTARTIPSVRWSAWTR